MKQATGKLRFIGKMTVKTVNGVCVGVCYVRVCVCVCHGVDSVDILTWHIGAVCC